MPDYKFQFLDEIGQLLWEQRLQASDDADALELARVFAHPSAIEVWQGDRRVSVVVPREKKG